MAPKGTEEPTPKRKRDARREGRIAKSNEVSAWSTLLSFAVLLPWAISVTHRNVLRALEQIPVLAQNPTNEAMLSALSVTLQATLATCVLIGGTLAVIALTATAAQVGFLITGKPLKPSIKRLNPISNAKNILGPRGLWETGKQVIRAAVMVFLAYGAISSLVRSMVNRAGENAVSLVAFAGRETLSFIKIAALVSFVLAVGDYGVQRALLRRELRMTRQEIRDEFRQSEGDPMVKQRIRSLQRDRARRRMMQEVATSTVVITNPTHYAVALRYSPGLAAPEVTAVGVENVALQIRERAIAAGVPIVEAPPLARALHRACQPGDSIPVALFEAVAQVLAAIGRMKTSLGIPVRLDVKVPDVTPRRRRRR